MDVRVNDGDVVDAGAEIFLPCGLPAVAISGGAGASCASAPGGSAPRPVKGDTARVAAAAAPVKNSRRVTPIFFTRPP